jgi:hypothetical protein
MAMQPTPIWLYDRWYGLAARERLRQLALWSPVPVLVYLNCGLPYGTEKQVEEEVKLFQREGIIKLWKYENERSFAGSLSTLAAGPAETIRDRDYEEIVRFVDSRLESTFPDLRVLGFEHMEGMLLEQVVLRRRFFSQAICGALKVNTLADAKDHVNLYVRQPSLFDEIGDTLEHFFSAVNVPSLLLLDTEGFLQLRQRSQAVLPEIVAEIYNQLEKEEASLGRAQAEAVERLMRQYESELQKLVKKQRGLGAKAAYKAFEEGTWTQIESQMALFYLNDPISDLAPWFSQSSDGHCKLALLLLEWKSGKFGLRTPHAR